MNRAVLALAATVLVGCPQPAPEKRTLPAEPAPLHDLPPAPSAGPLPGPDPSAVITEELNERTDWRRKAHHPQQPELPADARIAGPPGGR